MAQIELSGEFLNSSSSTPIVRVKDVWDDNNVSLTELLKNGSGSGSAGVSSLNSKTGAITIEAGTNVTIDNSTAGKIKISASGGGTGTGTPGVNGNSTEVRFAVSNTTIAPSISRSTRTPSGWSTSYTISDGQFLFRTEAIIDANNALVGSWSIPVRITPIDGQDGTNGTNGVSVTAIDKYFYDSNDRTTHPAENSTDWKELPACNKRYIWVKTKYTLSNGTSKVTYEVVSNGVDGTGESAVKLDLTNESAEINADASYNILAEATRPICTASLKYGTKTVSGATYSITTTPTATGVSINSTSGVLTFGSNFAFTGTSLSISVTGTGSVTGVGTVTDTKVMTVTKVLPGTNGEPATSYWLNLSADAIKVTADGVASPSTISAEAWKQVGANAPVKASDASIVYGYNTITPSTTYSNVITVDKTKDYITFVLKVGGVQRDIETVPILKDGNSLQGAIIRGPYNWDDIKSTAREFQSGDTDNGETFLDVVLYNNKYYYCKTSYNKAASTTTFDSSKWVEGESFDFIATNVLLAKNAKINFLSGNEITLTDVDGNVSAGARAASSGNDVVFWAGGNTSSLSSNPFFVTKDGSIKATKGTIGGLTLSGNSLRSAGDGIVLNADGSGSLANGQISWTSTGVTRIPSATINSLSVDKLTSGSITTGGLSFTNGSKNVLNLTSNEYKTINEFLGATSTTADINWPASYSTLMITASKSDYNPVVSNVSFGGNSPYPVTSEAKSTACSFQTSGTNDITITIKPMPTFDCSIMRDYRVITDTVLNSLSFTVNYYLDESTSSFYSVHYNYEMMSNNFSASVSTDFTKTQSLNAGSHSIKIGVTFNTIDFYSGAQNAEYLIMAGPAGSLSSSTGSPTLIGSVSYMVASNTSRGTEIFGNGLGVMTGASKYFVALSASDGEYLELVSGNRGIKITPTSLTAGFGNGSYYNLSPVYCAFNISYSSSSAATISKTLDPYGVTVSSSVSGNTITVTVSGLGSGYHVQFTPWDVNGDGQSNTPYLVATNNGSFQMTFCQATGGRNWRSGCKAGVTILKY